MDWTDDEIATLTRMQEAGSTAAVIAAQLKTTRNAILGKLFRLGFSRPRPEGRTIRRRGPDRPFAREEFRKPRTHAAPAPKIEAARYMLTGPTRMGRIQAAPELTKHELRRMLTQAVQNTK